jgi:putative NADH-flavin reductase
MNITVFGANGRVGSLVAVELLNRGHHVLAAIHGQSRLERHPNLTVTQVNIYDDASVAEALGSADAVVSALGSWGTKRKDVLTEGMKRIIPVAEALDIKRIVSLTGADARAPGDTLSLVHRLSHGLFSVTAGKVLRDGEEHIRLLSESSLDWAVVRSPVMKADGSGAYSLSSKRCKPWDSIPRVAVVQALCDLVESTQHSGSAPYIHQT